MKKRYQAIQKIVVALERLRSAKIDEAGKLTVAEAQDVVKASGAQTVDEVLAAYKAESDAEKAERRKRIKPLTSAQAQAIIEYHPIEGASIADWFKRWKQNDLNRIAQAVQRGAIEELSVDQVAANVWNACAVSRNSARTVARTIINGVSNAARIETLLANDDVIDGIEFLATLDARTSHICGALDGTVWRGEEMKRARRPPLHPNCRSTLIPVVDLIDPETGEKIEETARRPAQNADGSYSQVAAKTTFKDYFESQPETFQREWLGEKRFELWKSGRLKFEDLAKPATTYRATTADLTPPTEKPKETAASDDKPNRTPATIPSVEEIRKFTDDAEQSFDDEIAVAELWNARAQEAEEAGELENAAKFREKAAVLWAPITRKLNQLALDKFFPVDEPNSANRKTMTAKTPRRVQTPAPRGFSLLGPRKKYGWTEMSEKELGGIEKALDFVGRVMDNIGANAADLDGVHFHDKTEGRGYYDHGGAAGGKPRKIVLSHAFGDARKIGSCAAHELGHAFDHCVPGLQKKVVDFYVAVTTEPNGKRTKPKWLGSPYSRAEKYRPARPFFQVPGNYTLKSYREFQDSNNDSAREVSTEFVSMWCQELFKNPHAFIKKYPEFFQGILKVLSNGK